jgi:hypothetical protein
VRVVDVEDIDGNVEFINQHEPETDAGFALIVECEVTSCHQLVGSCRYGYVKETQHGLL